MCQRGAIKFQRSKARHQRMASFLADKIKLLGKQAIRQRSWDCLQPS